MNGNGIRMIDNDDTNNGIRMKISIIMVVVVVCGADAVVLFFVMDGLLCCLVFCYWRAEPINICLDEICSLLARWTYKYTTK
jgi:hypothetical protein